MLNIFRTCYGCSFFARQASRNPEESRNVPQAVNVCETRSVWKEDSETGTISEFEVMPGVAGAVDEVVFAKFHLR